VDGERTIPSSDSQPVDEVETEDIALACYLWHRGHDLLEAEWKGGRCTWVFSATANEDEDMYDQGMARVDPISYFGSVTEFKKLVYRNRPSQ
jgi:hypothetical protein